MVTPGGVDTQLATLPALVTLINILTHQALGVHTPVAGAATAEPSPLCVGAHLGTAPVVHLALVLVQARVSHRVQEEAPVTATLEMSWSVDTLAP